MISSGAEIRDRREGSHRVVGLLLEQERAEREWRGVREHEGGAVGRRAGDLQPADGAARAGLVVDHHRLPELLAELLGHDAREDVAGAAGREGDDDLDRLVRPLRERRQRERGGAGRQKLQRTAARGMVECGHGLAEQDRCPGGGGTMARQSLAS